MRQLPEMLPVTLTIWAQQTAVIDPRKKVSIYNTTGAAQYRPNDALWKWYAATLAAGCKI